MRPILLAAMAATITGVAMTAAHAQDNGPAKVAQTSLGPTLTDASGKTLYAYSRDMTGYSNCNAACAAAWPPMAAGAGAKASADWTIIVRDDGSKQWAYKGHALYTFGKDAAAGDTSGDGAESGKWHAAKP
jgi:predicted lipoprotein with Yx(FWY)xxD motif